MKRCNCHLNPPCPFCTSFTNADHPPEDGALVEVITDECITESTDAVYKDGKYLDYKDEPIKDVLGWRDPC
jgi:hypothetical protein